MRSGNNSSITAERRSRVPKKLFCRFCLHAVDVWVGLLPEVCGGCGRSAMWSTDPPEKALAERYQFTEGDRRFLSALKIGLDRVHG